jgi:hypothetical protein
MVVDEAEHILSPLSAIQNPGHEVQPLGYQLPIAAQVPIVQSHHGDAGFPLQGLRIHTHVGKGLENNLRLRGYAQEKLWVVPAPELTAEGQLFELWMSQGIRPGLQGLLPFFQIVNRNRSILARKISQQTQASRT